MKEALSYAFKLLSIKDYFKSELYEKISKKFSIEDGRNVIIYLEEYGYINDYKVAENYIRYKALSGYGVYYISSKLFQRGYKINNEKVKAIIEKDCISNEPVFLKAINRYKKNIGYNKYEKYNKCINYLINRGFSIDEIYKIVKKEEFK